MVIDPPWKKLRTDMKRRMREEQKRQRTEEAEKRYMRFLDDVRSGRLSEGQYARIGVIATLPEDVRETVTTRAIISRINSSWRKAELDDALYMVHHAHRSGLISNDERRTLVSIVCDTKSIREGYCVLLPELSKDQQEIMDKIRKSSKILVRKRIQEKNRLERDRKHVT